MKHAPSLRPSALALLVVFASPATADEPWAAMDYGPFLSTAVGIGGGQPPVNKGIVLRLRTADGAPTDLHAVFDTDLLAWRCVWTGTLALRGIVFDGPHGTFPEIDGEPLLRMPARPGFPDRDGAVDDPRDEPWGPIPPAWGRWSGIHLDGRDVVLEYRVHGGIHRVRERAWAEHHGDTLVFVREIEVATVDRAARAGPRLTLLEPSHQRARRVTVAGDGALLEDGVTLQAPANGTVRVAIAAADTPAAPARPEARATGIEEAIERARPRWGAPIVTRGVVDEDLTAPDGGRRIARPAGAAATTIDLVHAHGGRLELLRDGVSVDAGPGSSTVVVRSTPPPTTPVWQPADEIGWWPADTGHGPHERNAFTDAFDLRLDGVTWRRGVAEGRSLDFDGTAAAWLDDVPFDLDRHDLTIAAWIHTTRDGSVFAVAPPGGPWVPDGVTMFVRNGRLSFDVGWVGVVAGGPEITDGAWHHVAATWHHDDGAVTLYVDGERVASGELPLEGEDDRSGFVGRFGWTNENFPGTSRFSGYMDGPMLLRRAVDADAIDVIAATTGDALVEVTIIRAGEADEATIRRAADVVHLTLPATRRDAAYDIRTRRGPRAAALAWAEDALRERGDTARPFRIDRLTWPEDNRFRSWLRFGAFDFAPADDDAGASVYITTWSGDVWRVDGLDENLDALTWTRAATGLNQPFGVAVRGRTVLVLGRDQITRLLDRSGDGEADFLVNFNNDARNSEHFHEPASGLLATPDGDLLYHKAARHAKLALHMHHGSVIRVSSDGATSEVVAHGFRAPIGLARLPDGTLLGSDQEGHWTPANRINLIRPASGTTPAQFYGNGWAAPRAAGRRVTRDGERVHAPWSADDAMTPPLCWLHPTFDRSPSSHVYVDHPAWGPLRGAILGLSYGTGDVYLVLRDDVTGADGNPVTQGGVVKLGVQLPTGLLAGRIEPDTGDLYVCGLFGWSSDRTAPGGFYRIRPMTSAWERTLNVPHRVRAFDDGLELTFLHPLDAATATDPLRWTATAWNYRRTENYGSPTFDLAGRRDARTAWTVASATLAADGRTVRLRIDGFEPAMQVHVTWEIVDATGASLAHEVHLTVHAVRGRD
jgi:hypothetical protein